MLAFILALVAGLFTEKAVEPVGRPAAALIAPVAPIGEEEMRVFTFAVLMLAAAVIAALVGSGSPFWLALGGVLGLVGTRLYAALIRLIDQRR